MTIYVGFEIELEKNPRYTSLPAYELIKKLVCKTKHITGITNSSVQEYHTSEYKTSIGEWRLENDSSLRGGVEFISPPLPIDTALEKLSAFFSCLKGTGYMTTKRCGLHMNISSNDMDIKDIDCNAIIPAINYKLLYTLWGNRTKGNEYSVYLKDMLAVEKKSQLFEYSSSIYTSLESKLKAFSKRLLADRYNFINLRKFNQKNYFEIRIMGGKDYHKKFKAIESTVRHFEKVLTNAKNITKKQQKKVFSYINRITRSVDIFIPTCYDSTPILPAVGIKILQKSMANLKNIHKYDIKTLVKILYKDINFKSYCLRHNKNKTSIDTIHTYFMEYHKKIQRFRNYLNYKEINKMLNEVRYNYFKFLYFKAGKRNKVAAIKEARTYFYSLFKIPEEESPTNLLWVLDFIKYFPAKDRKFVIDNLSPKFLKFIIKHKRPGMISIAKKALETKNMSQDI